MHLYAIVRGKRSLVRRVLENFEEIFLPWYKDKDGKDVSVQVIPRKVELVEFVFPEQYLPEMVNTLGNAPPRNFKLLTKLLHLKPIPKNLKNKKRFIHGIKEEVGHPFVHFHLIGTKKDRKTKDGIELL